MFVDQESNLYDPQSIHQPRQRSSEDKEPFAFRPQNPMIAQLFRMGGSYTVTHAGKAFLSRHQP